MDIEHHPSLIAYLEGTGRIDPGEQVEVRTLPGGVSNRTVWLRRASGEAWVLKQALPQLRVAVEWFSDPRRVEREALGMKWLAHLAPAGSITPLVFLDPAHHLLAMAAVPDPHANWKQMLLAGGLEIEHIRAFGSLLGTIHRRSFEQQAALAPLFDDRSYFETLRLEPYYAYAAAQVPEAAQFLTRLIADCRARRLALVHGDYSPKNVLIRESQLILLDHEVIHWGDPAFDVGFAMAHLLSKAHHLAPHRDAFAAAACEFWNVYAAITRVDAGLEPMAARHTLGCLLARVAGRSILEYLTPDERLRQRHTVAALMQAPPARMAGLIDRLLRALDPPPR